MQNPVHWFEIYVQDMDRARRFYETVLDTKLQKLNAGDIEMWAFPRSREQGGTGGSLIKVDGVPSGGNSTLVYFACEDCAIEAGRVVAAGGKLARSKISIGEHGYVAMVLDTEGNMIGLHSLK